MNPIKIVLTIVAFIATTVMTEIAVQMDELPSPVATPSRDFSSQMRTSFCLLHSPHII
jgi:hypothetical protein